MKANEAPEKIYVTNYYIEALPKNEQLSERWHEVSTQDTDVEYTRTNAFIEKAAEWIKNKAENYIVDTPLCSYFDYKRAVEDFKEYIKGE